MSRLGPKLVVASGNRHKVAELRAMLQQAVPGLTVQGLAAHPGAPQIAETAPDFEGNAELKARGIAAWLAEQGEDGTTTVLADDSGISVDALGGMPGVISARFAGEPSDDENNNARLVAELKARGLDESPAHYSCVLALVRVDGTALPRSESPALLFAGTWPVVVRTRRRGNGGFGYDPHAWLPGKDRTVAELQSAEKAQLSHRGHALRQLLAWVREG